MQNDVVDIIVPVYNEESGLPEFFRRMTALPLNTRLIFIDNASTDNSLAMLKTCEGATVIEHQCNEGYGASLRDGIRAAGSDKIVIIDADCEYPPESIPDMVKALDEHEVVYASRFLGEQQARMPFLKMFGNRVISRLFNLLFDQQVTDLYTGSKAFRRSTVANLTMDRNGFEHVLEVAARLAKKGVTIHEIPVRFRARQTGTSKMSHLAETLKYLYFLVFYSITIPKSNSG
jgi:glycosyltransferase involved in cell wall biosynthesis